jgi:hypothetical protein
MGSYSLNASLNMNCLRRSHLAGFICKAAIHSCALLAGGVSVCGEGELKRHISVTELETAQAWLQEGRKVALATVISTWGSAPQPVGAQLVVDGEGHFAGAVSGGCVEGEVISAALDVISSGGQKVLEFGVAEETAWRVGLACGGTIRIYVEVLA